SLDMLWVVDDNFLVDIDRARGIAEGLIRAGSHFTWSVQATTNLVARLTAEDMQLLRRAGLHQFCQGVDAGSQIVLNAMGKTFQSVESIDESAARCNEAGTRPSCTPIFASTG